MLPILIGLLIGLLFFLSSREREPIARLEVPRVVSGPEAPGVESHKSSQTDSPAGSGAVADSDRVETELTAEKTDTLRHEAPCHIPSLAGRNSEEHSWV